VFTDWVAQPVDSWVVSHSTVGNIHQNDLKMFVGGILTSPVSLVEKGTTFHSQSPAPG